MESYGKRKVVRSSSASGRQIMGLLRIIRYSSVWANCFLQTLPQHSEFLDLVKDIYCLHAEYKRKQALRTTGWDITLDRKVLLMSDMPTAMTLEAADVSACDAECFPKP